MSSNQSAASPPEFLLDRCIGARTAGALTDRGWRVHHIGEIYPNDACEVSDEVWISYGAERGWGLLTKDARIRYRAAEKNALMVGGGVMFQLYSGNLTIDQGIWTFDQLRTPIEHAMRRGGPTYYIVGPRRLRSIRL